MTTVVEEVLSATGVTIGEDVQTALMNMVQGINNLDDDSWQQLSPETQSWFNDAAKILQEGEGEDLPLCPGMTLPSAVEEGEAVKEEAVVKEKPEVKEKPAKKAVEEKKEPTKEKSKKSDKPDKPPR